MEYMGQDLLLQSEDGHAGCHYNSLGDNESTHVTEQNLLEVDRS